MPTAAGRQSVPKILLSSIAWLSLAFAAAVPAAPCGAVGECDSVSDLGSADAFLGRLALRLVDLGDAGSADEAAGATDAPHAMAPLLFLAPRVTSILEDVFPDDADMKVNDGATNDGSTKTHPQAVFSSPLAESDSAASDAPSPETDHASILPKYQRQMYRTDI